MPGQVAYLCDCLLRCLQLLTPAEQLLLQRSNVAATLHMKLRDEPISLFQLCPLHLRATRALIQDVCHTHTHTFSCLVVSCSCCWACSCTLCSCSCRARSCSWEAARSCAKKRGQQNSPLCFPASLVPRPPLLPG